jgi:hypothetical protein
MYRNLLTGIFVLGFLTAVFPTAAHAQNAAGQKTPVQKKQIIVSVTAARVRSAPDLAAETLRQAGIGTVFTALEERAGWTKVKLSDGREGWISKTITEDFVPAARTKTYTALADKYLARENLDFKTAAEVFYFLKKASAETDAAAIELRRFRMLEKALGLIPFERVNDSPYKDFTDKNAGEIVYSEPAGRWYVNAKLLWELHAENKNKPIGEEIAWQAAQTNLPGECEGYVNCYIYLLRVTAGEYLNFYPAGRYSRQALTNLTNFLEPLSQDSARQTGYTGPYDMSDRAELNKHLAELRQIVSKTPYVEKQKTIDQLNRIAEVFK